ncbi:MAG TPA: glutaredoxin domain-containing protein [Polyangiaceae bacterium]
MSRRAWSARAGTWAALFAAFTMVLSPGCKRRPLDELPPEQDPPTQTLPALTLTDDTPDLLMTWVDGRGDAHTAKKPADVPMEGRDQVRVMMTTREEGTRNLFYVANLTVKNLDGTYPVTTMPRVEWDAMIAKRRQAFAASSAAPKNDEPPSPGAQADPAVPASFTVIVYGAAWCGACHEAVAYLKRRKVPVVEKDIEQDPAAEQEMRTKLARAGFHGGSIPVIDVKGKILIGFEPHALEAAVRGASAVAL